MSAVSINTYTHSVTYVTDNILKSLKDIVRLSGLNPEKLTTDWDSNQRAIKTWIESGYLERVQLEIFDPSTNGLIVRWDIDILYSTGGGNGTFYTDTEQLKYSIKKAGVAPASAYYDVLLQNKPGRPDVDGWGPVSARSTEGMVRQSLGSTIEHNGLGASAAYWRTR
ncbi:HORMA domain containing protein [Paucibacter sp. Y2R2-4]|uniref:HORMA domain containing protein n=1 Tax=Paucibacter sp. Y2R2-4 TaxID=2893553 RepID=UPI0021E4F8F0|nr:HORMA domain containing protein [Paucibacter sp. Y2R2-4]MCV2350800.1 HORMA domain containing protein [Paucibacter sp. Y2R2-4]